MIRGIGIGGFSSGKDQMLQKKCQIMRKKYQLSNMKYNFWKLNKYKFEKIQPNELPMCSTKEGFVRVTVMKSETIELVR